MSPLVIVYNFSVSQPLLCRVCGENKVRLDKHFVSGHRDMTVSFSLTFLDTSCRDCEVISLDVDTSYGNTARVSNSPLCIHVICVVSVSILRYACVCFTA